MTRLNANKRDDLKIQQRYWGANSVDIQDAISGRRAVREYLSEAVDEPTIRRLIDAAIQAPSAINQQPWVFAVVRDQRLLDRISEKSKVLALAAAPAHARSEPHLAMLDDPDFHIFYHAPVLILIFGHENGPWIVQDCAGGRKSHALCPRHGPGQLLDRIRPALSRNRGRQVAARSARGRGPGCAHHRGTSKARDPSRPPQVS